MSWDWLGQVAPENDGLRLIMGLMVLATIVILRYGLPAIRQAVRDGATKEDADLFKQLNEMAKETVRETREDMKALRREMDAQRRQFTADIEALQVDVRQARKRLSKAIHVILVQNAHIEKHLPERTDNPVIPPDLLEEDA